MMQNPYTGEWYGNSKEEFERYRKDMERYERKNSIGRLRLMYIQGLLYIIGSLVFLVNIETWKHDLFSWEYLRTYEGETVYAFIIGVAFYLMIRGPYLCMKAGAGGHIPGWSDAIISPWAIIRGFFRGITGYGSKPKGKFTNIERTIEYRDSVLNSLNNEEGAKKLGKSMGIVHIQNGGPETERVLQYIDSELNSKSNEEALDYIEKFKL